jgi:hypothetical protein
MDAAVPSVEEDGYGDSEPEDEEEEGGADIQEDFEYWAEEGDCTRVHSLLEEEEEEDTESDACRSCDESGTACTLPSSDALKIYFSLNFEFSNIQK